MASGNVAITIRFAGLDQTGAAVKKAGKGIDKFGKDAARSTRKAGKATKELTIGFKDMQKGVAAAANRFNETMQAAKTLGEMVKGVFDMAQAAEFSRNVERTFSNLVSSGGTAVSAMRQLRESSGMLIDDTGLQQMHNKMSLMGADLDTINGLLRLTSQISGATGEGFEQLTAQFQEAIISGDKGTLTKLGLFLDLNAALEVEAIKLGKVTAQLTKQEAMTARLEIATRAFTGSLVEQGVELGRLETKVQTLGSHWSNIKDQMAREWSDKFTLALDWAGTDAFLSSAQKQKKEINQLFDDLTEARDLLDKNWQGKAQWYRKEQKKKWSTIEQQVEQSIQKFAKLNEFERKDIDLTVQSFIDGKMGETVARANFEAALLNSLQREKRARQQVEAATVAQNKAVDEQVRIWRASTGMAWWFDSLEGKRKRPPKDPRPPGGGDADARALLTAKQSLEVQQLRAQGAKEAQIEELKLAQKIRALEESSAALRGDKAKAAQLDLQRLWSEFHLLTEKNESERAAAQSKLSLEKLIHTHTAQRMRAELTGASEIEIAALTHAQAVKEIRADDLSAQEQARQIELERLQFALDQAQILKDLKTDLLEKEREQLEQTSRAWEGYAQHVGAAATTIESEVPGMATLIQAQAVSMQTMAQHGMDFQKAVPGVLSGVGAVAAGQASSVRKSAGLQSAFEAAAAIASFATGNAWAGAMHTQAAAMYAAVAAGAGGGKKSASSTAAGGAGGGVGAGGGGVSQGWLSDSASGSTVVVNVAGLVAGSTADLGEQIAQQVDGVRSTGLGQAQV